MNPGFETRMVHAGHVPDPVHGARAVPIFQTTSFVFEDADQAAQLFALKDYGHLYTRISNPTTSVLEERIASLEGGTGALATASGMAAQFATFFTLLQPGDEFVASAHLYGGSLTQFAHSFRKLGITCRTVPPRDLAAWDAACSPRTRALYVETIGNPSGAIADLAALASLARTRGIPLIVDNTFATPWLCRPLEHGAHIVLHSATKFLGGHGTAIGGAIVDGGTFDFSSHPILSAPSPAYHGLNFADTFGHYGFLAKARAETLRDTGACLSPFNAFLILQGIETLSLRMERQVANALTIATWLEQHPRVAWVAYAGLPSHPDHALARRYLPSGPGAVFSFGLKAPPENARNAGRTFISSLRLVSHLANVGDVRTLVIHPASTTHQQLSDAELAAAGIGPELIRLSIGIETASDLIADLDSALSAIQP